MTHEARTTVRNAGLLLAQRGLHVVAGLAFALLVPRLMGPTIFGQYTLVFSVSLWFSLLSGMGAMSVMSHFVPQFVARGDTAGLRKLVSNLFVARLMNGVSAGALYFVLMMLWLRDLDWAALALIGAAVAVRTSANLFFTLFLGLNRAARWGMGELLRRWLTLVLVLSGFYAAGLRGACLGILLANVGVLVLGLAWGGAFLERSELRIDAPFLKPFIRFSVQFASGNLVLVLTQRSGEALVRLVSNDYVQVAYYGAAYAAYLIIAQALWQFSAGFAPLLNTLRGTRDEAALRLWIERLLKWLSISAMVAAAGIVLLAPRFVPVMLGARYQEVADSLIPLAAALPAYVLCVIGRVLTVTYERPRVATTAAILELAVFWVVGLYLVRSAGSVGAAVAAAVAVCTYAAYVTWCMRIQLPYSVAGWLRIVAIGSLVVPLAPFARTVPSAAAAFAAYLALFGAFLFVLRVITIDELRALLTGVRG